LSEAETSQTLFIGPNGVQHWLKTYKSLAKALHDQVQTHIVDLQRLRGNYFQELIHGYIALTSTTPIVLAVDGLLSHAESFIRALSDGMRQDAGLILEPAWDNSLKQYQIAYGAYKRASVNMADTLRDIKQSANLTQAGNRNSLQVRQRYIFRQ
ncbi:hypothetical protein DXG01_016596, partial [Tephrocybe rancida]